MTASPLPPPHPLPFPKIWVVYQWIFLYYSFFWLHFRPSWAYFFILLLSTFSFYTHTAKHTVPDTHIQWQTHSYRHTHTSLTTLSSHNEGNSLGKMKEKTKIHTTFLAPWRIPMGETQREGWIKRKLSRPLFPLYIYLSAATRVCGSRENAL